jgi:hypothetical protein
MTNLGLKFCILLAEVSAKGGSNVIQIPDMHWNFDVMIAWFQGILNWGVLSLPTWQICYPHVAWTSWKFEDVLSNESDHGAFL